MSIKLKNLKINPEFEDLFSFNSKDEKIAHEAQMISYRILSALEKVCDEKNIRKKDLADMVGASRSYITQLFRGAKMVNTNIMAKFEENLGITFQVNAKYNEDSHEEFLPRQLPLGFFHHKRYSQKGFSMYCFPGKKTTNEFLDAMDSENNSLQKSA